MRTLCICVGSSCHIKGSYQVVKTFERLIAENDLSEKVKIKASFCQGQCMRGIAVTLDEEPVEGISVTSAEQIFREQILPRL